MARTVPADTFVRHLSGIDPRPPDMAIADQVEPGMHLAFCARNAEAARRDLVRIATENPGRTGMQHDNAPVRHPVCRCSGRGGPHFQGARHAELQTVRDALGEVPLFVALRRRRDRKKSPLRLHGGIDGVYLDSWVIAFHGNQYP